MTRWSRITVLAMTLLVPSLDALGELRFPPPEFESGYQFPQTTAPGAKAVNDVELDMEMTKTVETSVMYNTFVQAMVKRIEGIRIAIADKI